jgi:membrane protease YdiL (CAAX protease family)
MMPLAAYLVTTVALSVLFTVVMVKTGSLLLPLLMHAATNASSDIMFALYRRVFDLGPPWWTVVSLAVAGLLTLPTLRRATALEQAALPG